MTPYEIVDLQLNIAEKITHTFRWWVSITFAALVAAYVAGPDLAGAPCAIILFAYTVVSLGTLNAQRVYLGVADGLVNESLAYQAQAELPSPVLEEVFIDRLGGPAVIGAQVVLRGIMFLATIGYVLYRAGYIG